MEFVNNGVWFVTGALDVVDRFVQQGIERTTFGVDGIHTVAAEKIFHRPQHHFDALYDWLTVATALSCIDGALEVVDDVKEVPEQLFTLVAYAFVALLADSFSRIISLSERAQVLVLQFG